MLPLPRASARALLTPRLFRPFLGPLTPLTARRPSPPTPLSHHHHRRALTNQAAVLRDFLLTRNQSKWGWVIYRTSYTDPPSPNPTTPGTTSDAAWALLQARLTAMAGDALAIGYPDGAADTAAAVRHLREAMDWVFVEDREALEGATREQLRARFRRWREGAMKEEVGERAPEVVNGVVMEPIASPRYRFFLVVDGEAMESIAEGEGGNLEGAWVDLVRCDEEVEDLAVVRRERRERRERDKRMGGWMKEEAEREEADVGKEDEWWFRVAVDVIGHEFYNSIGGPVDHWYVYYQPPPEVLWV